MAQIEIFLYTMKSSTNPDRVDGMVPFRVSDRHIFFGPGETPLRRDFRKRFLTFSSDVRPENDIYFVGVNELGREKARKILWVGKLNRVMTFEIAHSLLMDPEYESLVYVEAKESSGQNMSPLHLEPQEIMGNLSGYRHRTDYHAKVGRDGIPEWVKDVADPRDKDMFTIMGNELILGDMSVKKKVLSRDCCMTFDNIFYAQKKGMPINDEFVKMLDEKQPGQQVDAVGIFGYSQGRDGKRVMNKQKGNALHIRWKLAERMLDYLMNNHPSQE